MIEGETRRYQQFGRDGEGWLTVDPPCEDAIVFVHGFGGDFRETWTWKSSGWKFWDNKSTSLLGDLFAKDSDLSCDYYSFSHSAGIFDKATVKDLATALRTFIDNV